VTGLSHPLYLSFRTCARQCNRQLCAGRVRTLLPPIARTSTAASSSLFSGQTAMEAVDFWTRPLEWGAPFSCEVANR
jgi:hypothetical protein